jgi:hypothetical protein
MSDDNKVIYLGDWLSRKGPHKPLEGEPPPENPEPVMNEAGKMLIPPEKHPDPTIRLAAAMMKVLRENALTHNPAEMLVALSLAYTSVVRTFELQFGTKEAERMVAESERVTQLYTMVFHNDGKT